MNRKIAALALAGAVLLIGACGNDGEPEATPSTTVAMPEDTTPPLTDEELALVEVEMTKPEPGATVDPTSLPEEVARAAMVPNITEEQQNCVAAAIKQALEKDPTLSETPGKAASVSGKALTVCDASSLITDPLVDGLNAGEADTEYKITDAEATCLKDAFAADPDATSTAVSAMMAGKPDTVQDALAPFEERCDVNLGGLSGGYPS
jgi:hypothetical protein